MVDDTVVNKSREKLKKTVEAEITKLFESVLDYAQVAVPTSDTFKVLRSKILRVGNNCIRTIKDKLEHYDVEYTAVGEEIIEIQQQSK